MKAPVVFSPFRGVVVDIPLGIPEDLPSPARVFLNTSEPTQVMRNLEADICTRQYGEVTLLRDQKRSIVYRTFPAPQYFQRADIGLDAPANAPYVGVVEIPT